MRKIALAAALLASSMLAAQSPYSVNIFPAKVITATSTTTTAINLGTVATVPKSGSYSSGVIQLTGTALTTATFGVTASSDNGVTFFAVPICTVAATPSCATTQTATAAALYAINLGGLTHIKYVTSGTFTATNISLILTAAPNSQISKSSAGGTPAACTDGNNYDCLNIAQTITAAKVISSGATGVGLELTATSATETALKVSNGLNHVRWSLSGSASGSFAGDMCLFNDTNSGLAQFCSSSFGGGNVPFSLPGGSSFGWCNSTSAAACFADTAISRVAAGAMGVGANVNSGDITGTLQSGVRASDPGCTIAGNIGKLWFDITTTTTALKVCMNVAGTLTWVVK